MNHSISGLFFCSSFVDFKFSFFYFNCVKFLLKRTFSGVDSLSWVYVWRVFGGVISLLQKKIRKKTRPKHKCHLLCSLLRIPELENHRTECVELRDRVQLKSFTFTKWLMLAKMSKKQVTIRRFYYEGKQGIFG